MALAYRISPSGNHVRIVGRGKITADECIDLVEHIMADPRNRPGSTALVDLRAATYATELQAEVINIAEALETFQSLLAGSIAIVANPALLLPAEIFSTHVRKAAHVAVRVFVDIAAAETFLQGHAA